MTIFAGGPYAFQDAHYFALMNGTVATSAGIVRSTNASSYPACNLARIQKLVGSVCSSGASLSNCADVDRTTFGQFGLEGLPALPRDCPQSAIHKGSRQQKTSVDRDHRSGHVARGVGDEQHDRAVEIALVAEAALRDAAVVRLPPQSSRRKREAWKGAWQGAACRAPSPAPSARRSPP
jgi:hypothetical protein